MPSRGAQGAGMSCAVSWSKKLQMAPKRAPKRARSAPHLGAPRAARAAWDRARRSACPPSYVLGGGRARGARRGAPRRREAPGHATHFAACLAAAAPQPAAAGATAQCARTAGALWLLPGKISDSRAPIDPPIAGPARARRARRRQRHPWRRSPLAGAPYLARGHWQAWLGETGRGRRGEGWRTGRWHERLDRGDAARDTGAQARHCPTTRSPRPRHVMGHLLRASCGPDGCARDFGAAAKKKKDPLKKIFFLESIMPHFCSQTRHRVCN